MYARLWEVSEQLTGVYLGWPRSSICALSGPLPQICCLIDIARGSFGWRHWHGIEYPVIAICFSPRRGYDTVIAVLIQFLDGQAIDLTALRAELA